VTDNMNFGNPEKPEIMGQFAAAIRGMSAACRALDFPVVSGNVSLYNETDGRGILPTPTIGGLGLLEDASRAVGIALMPWLDLVLIGATKGWLGQSVWLREIAGREDGAPPPVDLDAELKHGDFVRGLILAGTARACHDISDGGLLVAVAEMALAGNVGVRLNAGPREILNHAYWFGEDQGRYLVAVGDGAEVVRVAEAAGIPAARIGTSGGRDLTLPDRGTISLATLRTAHERFFPALMGS
jgi:phosphoribosylformylglycinamidine synthase